tara:strand:+ start:40007 stop:41233 length:1227 start_codon:yes stop_codon:yes gene_type:complete
MLASEKLDFKGEYSAVTGEVYDNKIIAKIHFCEVRVYKSGLVIFSGSIHKMYNSIKKINAPNYKPLSKEQKDKGHRDLYKGFNGNQFGINEINFVIKYLEKLLFCKASDMIIRSIELGLNLEIDFNPQLFILGLLYYKNIPFEFKYKRGFAQVEFEDFRIKIYNKSKQYDLKKHTIRIEVNFSRMAKLNQKGLNNLEIKPEELFKGLKVVLEKFDAINYYDDTIKLKDLSKPQKRNLTKYRDVRYWLEDIKPNKRDEPKKKLKSLIEKHSSNLKEIIKNEFLKTRVINTQQNRTKEEVINTYSSIEENITRNEHSYCIVTGVKLIGKDEKAKYSRTTTLKYLRSNDKKRYFEVCSYLLNKSNEHHTKYESAIISHLAKQVRNRFNSKKEIREIGYKSKKYENQLSLNI